MSKCNELLVELIGDTTFGVVKAHECEVHGREEACQKADALLDKVKRSLDELGTHGCIPKAEAKEEKKEIKRKIKKVRK